MLTRVKGPPHCPLGACPDRFGRTWLQLNTHPVRGQLDSDRMSTIPELKRDGGQLVGDDRVQVQSIFTGFNTSIAAHHHVGGVSHGSQVNTFAGVAS